LSTIRPLTSVAPLKAAVRTRVVSVASVPIGTIVVSAAIAAIARRRTEKA